MQSRTVVLEYSRFKPNGMKFFKLLVISGRNDPRVGCLSLQNAGKRQNPKFIQNENCLGLSKNAEVG